MLTSNTIFTFDSRLHDRPTSRWHRWAALAAAALLVGTSASLAAAAEHGRERNESSRSEPPRYEAQHNDSRGDERSVGRGPANGYVFDSRYHHDRYYPPRGYLAPRIERGARVVLYGNNRYYYRGGAWYRPSGARWLVVAPPIGLVIPFLPDFYTTLWFGGVPYYYANDSYYVWRREARGYVVVDPPGNNQSPDYGGALPQEDFFVYPTRGQNAELQSRDRYECHRWAVSQTDFDPSEPSGGVAESQNAAKRADYRRAITACLEGRGYSVK